MANYRNISVTFWTDSKVDDEFTPEDKYFYLYLLTNPHTNICGCYEISMKQMERETGYNFDTVKRLIKRMQQTHKVIKYCEETKEILIVNWCKYNWTGSDNVKKAVLKVSEYIKSDNFRKYVVDTVSIGYPYRMETSVSDTDTDSETETDTDTDSETDTEYRYRDRNEAEKPKRHRYGEYNHVLLSDLEFQKLKDDFGDDVTSEYIRKVDEYCEQSGKTYKNYYLAIRNTFMKRDGIKAAKKKEEEQHDWLKREDLPNGNWILYYADREEEYDFCGNLLARRFKKR